MGPDYTAKADPLYIAFKEWAELNGEYKMPQKDFAGALQERGFERKRTKHGNVWYGIGLRFDGDPPDKGTPVYPGSAEGTPPESGVGKPKTRDSEARVYPGVPKIGMNAHNTLANRELTPKRVHQGTLLHPFEFPQSHEELIEAIARADTEEGE